MGCCTPARQQIPGSLFLNHKEVQQRLGQILPHLTLLQSNPCKAVAITTTPHSYKVKAKHSLGPSVNQFCSKQLDKSWETIVPSQLLFIPGHCSKGSLPTHPVSFLSFLISWLLCAWQPALLTPHLHRPHKTLPWPLVWALATYSAISKLTYLYSLL